MKLKLYGILAIIVIAIGLFVAQFLNNHSFVSNKFIKQKSDSIRVQKKEIAIKDSLLFSCQQTVDISNKIISEQQIVQEETNKRLQACKNAENTCCEELLHAEQNGGIIRDTIRLNIFGKPKRKK